MGLSKDLISQFVKTTKDEPKKSKETTVYGTIQKNTDGIVCAKLDGSDILTPVKSTVLVEENDRVTVMIKNHTATVTGNLTDPAANEGIIEAEKGRIDELETANLTVQNTLTAQDAVIKNLDTTYASIKYLDSNYLSAGKIDADYAKIDDIEATYAKISSLDAIQGNITTLNSEIANIDTLIFGSATGNVIQTSFSNAVIGQLGDAQIKSAMIESVSAGKITAGDIITNNVRVMSEDGSLIISDETLQISDGTRVRVQIGKDAASDYSINIWDQNGNLMFSKGGITDAAIKEAIIRNDMVSDTANIHASKLDIDSLFEEINGSSNTIKSTQVKLDDRNQTLDVAFKTLTDEVTSQGNTISSQGTKISTILGQISSKIWQQDINTAKNEMSTQYSTLEQNLGSFKTTVGNTYATKSDLNGLTIGGRNLIRDSKMNIDTDMWDMDYNHQTISFEHGYMEASRVYDASYTGRSFNTQYSSENPLLMPDDISNKTYVLQVELKAIDGITPSSQSSVFWRVYYDNSTNYEEITLYIPSDLSTTEWRRCYAVHTFGNRNWTNSQVSIALVNSVNGVCVRNLMLEQATKPSNWTSASEDIETRVINAETKITQNANSITAVTTRTTNNETAIASLELTADGLTTKIDTAKKQIYHSASGTSGTTGYVGICTFKINNTYQNRPILFEINNRGQVSSNISVCFNNTNTTDPGIMHIQSDGDIKSWIYKTGTSTWTLIIQKSEGYDTLYVKDFTNNNASIAVSWTNTMYTALPTENITEATLLAGKIKKSVVDNAAKTATNYLNFSSSGLVIGDMTASTLGKNVLIDSDSVDIRNGDTTLASFGADYLYLAKNSRNAKIDLCNGLATMYHESKYSYDTLFVIDTPNATEIQGTYNPLCVTSTVSGKVSIQFANTSGVIGSIGMVESGTESYITRNHPSTAATYSILDTGNYYKIMDSGWINCTLNTGTFSRYNNDIPQPQVRKIGKQVYLRGEAKPVVAVTPESDSDTVIATIPSGYRPSERQQFIMQGSGSYRWMMSIHTDGRIAISRYSNTTTANMNISAGTWLCCHAQWLID